MLLACCPVLRVTSSFLQHGCGVHFVIEKVCNMGCTKSGQSQDVLIDDEKDAGVDVLTFLHLSAVSVEILSSLRAGLLLILPPCFTTDMLRTEVRLSFVADIPGKPAEEAKGHFVVPREPAHRLQRTKTG